MAPSPATDWAVAKGKPARLLHAARLALQYYIVRVDAAPGVDVPGGSFVTVESGPHAGLEQALSTLEHPRPRVGAAAAQPACCDAVDRAGGAAATHACHAVAAPSPLLAAPRCAPPAQSPAP